MDLEVLEEHEDSFILAVGSHRIYIFQGEDASIEYAHGSHASSTLVFMVDDIDSKMTQLRQHGVAFLHEIPNQNRWGRYAAFKGPSGIIQELFELSP